MKRGLAWVVFIVACGSSSDDDGPGGDTIPIETPPTCDIPTGSPVPIANGTYPIARWYCLGKDEGIYDDPSSCPIEGNYLANSTSFEVVIEMNNNATVTFSPNGRVLVGMTDDDRNDSVIHLPGPDTIEGFVYRCHMDTTSTLAGTLTMGGPFGLVSWEFR